MSWKSHLKKLQKYPEPLEKENLMVLWRNVYYATEDKKTFHAALTLQKLTLKNILQDHYNLLFLPK